MRFLPNLLDSASFLLSPIGRQYLRSELRVLMFHGLTDVEHTGLENCQHKHLHVRHFEGIMEHLAHNYQVLSMDEAVRHLEEKRKFPPFSAVITFDDGFASNYHLAFPILRRFNLSAVIYLATEFVDEKIPIWVDRVDYAMSRAGGSKMDLVTTKNRLKTMAHNQTLNEVRLLEEKLGHGLVNVTAPDVPSIYRALDWQQIREMASSGLISFGSHTHSHIILGRANPESILNEIKISRSIIETETGSPCRHFCYPNGTSMDFSETSEAILKDQKFVSSVTTLGGLNRPPCSPFLLRRLGITNDLRHAQTIQYLALGSASARGLLPKFLGSMRLSSSHSRHHSLTD
jgi:peptidoglycan/xylan/chitin deacetylase (PgdA/CDA1 family)